MQQSRTYGEGWLRCNHIFDRARRIGVNHEAANGAAPPSQMPQNMPPAHMHTRTCMAASPKAQMDMMMLVLEGINKLSI